MSPERLAMLEELKIVMKKAFREAAELERQRCAKIADDMGAAEVAREIRK